MPIVRLSDGTPVRVESIYGVGRNYREHARELGNEPPPEPIFFTKPSSSLWDGTEPVELPFDRGPIHHEVELVALLAEGGERLERREARRAIRAVGVGLDLTLRALQSQLKAKGLPWALAKAFRNSSIVSPLCEVAPDLDLQALSLSLSVSGHVRQSETTASMIFPVDELIAYLSARVPLLPGDLVFTGTPAGVGELRPGDHLEARLGDLARLQVTLGS